jgi:peptide/nickel transport system substrate-binding protein
MSYFVQRVSSIFIGLFIFAAFSQAQPRKEEEEPTPPPVVPVPKKDLSPEKVSPKTPLAPEVKKESTAPEPYDMGVASFAQETAKTSSAGVRELFRPLMIEYDRLESTFQGGNNFRVKPLPFRELPEEPITVDIYDQTMKNPTERKFPTGSGFKFVPFELVVLEEVDYWLDHAGKTFKRQEQLDIAARAISSGLRFHRAAVSSKKRIGKEWQEVEKLLKTRLVKLQRERLQVLMNDGDFDRADEVALKLLAVNPDQTDILKDIYGLQLTRASKRTKSPSDEEMVKLRESLNLYTRLPGNRDEKLVATAQRLLRERASALVAEAKTLDAQKQSAVALSKLRAAEALDPDVPGIGDARLRLRGQILYVGVKSLPERMSPATAQSDSERFAVELMFEGLLQAVPGPQVGRYRPQLAQTLPAVSYLGRTFTLPQNIRWGKEGENLDARDIRGTLTLLNKPTFRERWPAAGLDIFRAIDRIDDPFRLRLSYDHGVLEPLSRATFKVIPARYLQEHGKNADDDVFAKAPFGTGPFRYEGREREQIGRESVIFRANPFYGQRAGQFGHPFIREIRMVVPNSSEVEKDVASGQLHLYSDAPSEMVARVLQSEKLSNVIRVEKSQTNRRIHLLAVNHRRLAMQNEKLRQGLLTAIDRETILNDLFRKEGTKGHQALTGPFPLECWATPVAARNTPLFKPGAGGLMAEALKEPLDLKLLYNKDEAKGLAVCQAIKGQLEQASTMGSRQLIRVEIVGLDADKYREKLYLEHDYDLALTSFDYQDDLFSLSEWLDPSAAGRNGRNFLGYLAEGSNPTDADRRFKRLLDDVGQYRDFNNQVKEKMWDLHAMVNQRVPFIPLWQLDRVMLIHRDLEISVDRPDVTIPASRLDPAVLFTGVEMWRFK